MPIVLRIGGFRFFFYANEGQEPAHIHVRNAEHEAKFWLLPVSLASVKGFNSKEINALFSLVREHQALLVASWKEFFKVEDQLK